MEKLPENFEPSIILPNDKQLRRQLEKKLEEYEARREKYSGFLVSLLEIDEDEENLTGAILAKLATIDPDGGSAWMIELYFKKYLDAFYKSEGLKILLEGRSLSKEALVDKLGEIPEELGEDPISNAMVVLRNYIEKGGEGLKNGTGMPPSE